MIYTVGNKRNYMLAILASPNGKAQKIGRCENLNGKPYSGGYALRTVEDAERLIIQLGQEGAWAVFGLDADWEADTMQAEDGWWHDLLRDADIIVLDEQPS